MFVLTTTPKKKIQQTDPEATPAGAWYTKTTSR